MTPVAPASALVDPSLRNSRTDVSYQCAIKKVRCSCPVPPLPDPLPPGERGTSPLPRREGIKGEGEPSNSTYYSFESTLVSVSSCVYRALAEIDRLLAAGTLNLFVKFIREDLDRLVTTGTLARKRLEFFVGFKSGTMHGC